MDNPKSSYRTLLVGPYGAPTLSLYHQRDTRWKDKRDQQILFSLQIVTKRGKTYCTPLFSASRMKRLARAILRAIKEIEEREQ